MLGLVSAGVVLIILALTWLSYPDILTMLTDYFQSWAIHMGPVLPPQRLGAAIIFFLNLSGVWGLIIGGLRIVFMHHPRRAVGNVAGGVFAIYLAYILSGYYAGTVAANTLLPLFLVGLGILIIINVIGEIIAYSLRRRPTGQTMPTI